MDRVNIFNPFVRRPTEHEDRLTWAFLIALRYEPTLQRLLRDLVLDAVPAGRFRGRQEWRAARVQTQTDRIGSEAVFVVSVLLSDEALGDKVPVHWVDRRARYDGVVEFSDGLVLVIENKPARGDVWEGQLSLARESLLGEPDDVELHEVAVSLSWPDLLEEILLLAGSELPSFAGRQIAKDFLALVEEVHPDLNPYRTFALCSGRPEALAKRTEALVGALAEITDHEVRAHPGDPPFLSRPGQIAQEVQLTVPRDGDRGVVLRLALWPADTVNQARRFFDAVDREAFFGLRDLGWIIRPNLHFSFMSTHLVWCDTTVTSEEYFDCYKDGTERYGQFQVDDTLGARVAAWKDRGLLTDLDSDEISRHFLNTRRERINMIPGFEVSYLMSLEDVMALESAGDLEASVLARFGEALGAWGEELRVVPPREQTTAAH